MWCKRESARNLSFASEKYCLRLVAADSSRCPYVLVFVLEKASKKKNMYVRKHSTSVQISLQEFTYWFADVQNLSATSRFWCRCVSVFCTIFTAAIVAKHVSVRVSWFVIRRIGFVHLQWRIREGVTVVLCLWEREKNLQVCNFCLWLQIYWYTCVAILYNYKFRCHRRSVVLHQNYLHSLAPLSETSRASASSASDPEPTDPPWTLRPAETASSSQPPGLTSSARSGSAFCPLNATTSRFTETCL